MRQEDYPPGTIVFAKLKGYPWWPARIEDERDVPAAVMKQKSPRSKSPLWTVFFFGSRDYGFFGPDAIRPFNREVVEHELKAKKFKTKDLENAVREALNPSSIEREQQEDEDEEEEEESEEENKKSKRGKTTRRRGGTSETKRRGAASSSSNGRKPRGKAKAEDEGQDEEDEAKMRRRSRRIEDEDKDLDDTETPGRKKRRKSISAEREEPQAEHRNTDNSQADNTSKSRPDLSNMSPDYQAQYKKVYKLRHMLQKLVYDKKPGEIPKEHYQKISEVLHEIEETEMTRRLMRETKIGKVLNYAAMYNFEDDTEYNLQTRFHQLMQDWIERWGRGDRANTKNGKDGESSKAAEEKEEAAPTNMSTKSEDNEESSSSHENVKAETEAEESKEENTETKDSMEVDTPKPEEMDTSEDAVEKPVTEQEGQTSSAAVLDTPMQEAS